MFYLIHDSGYDDPVPMTGPFASYGDALAAYRRSLIDAGADIDPDEPTESLYVEDDAIRIGKVA